MPRSTKREAADATVSGATLAAAERGVSFGPLFFLRHLGGLVRERCPDPSEAAPRVQAALADGTVLDLCHIIGVTPKWIAFAVFDTEHGGGSERMRTELVPYAMITRLSIRTDPGHGIHRMGFDVDRNPEVREGRGGPEPRSAEDALQAVGRKSGRPGDA